MLTVTREHTIAAAHRLYAYDGRCERLHGHNYRVLATLTADALDDLGVVVDFAEIKSVLFKALDEAWDHRTLLYDQDPLCASLQGLDTDNAIVPLPFNPTAENMASYLGTHIFPKAMQDAKMKGLRIVSVTVYETANSQATWFAD